MMGWVLHIPVMTQIIPGFIPMVFNTALCFVLFGCALLSAQYNIRRFRSPVYLAFSFAGMLIGLITLFQFLFHFNTGLDELFVKDTEAISPQHLFAGRMAFNSTINIFILGSGFLALSAQKRNINLLAQYLFHAVTILSAIALVGYLYGVSLFDALFYLSSMATQTAILFFILSVAASLLNPSMGLTHLFTGNRIGNQMARRLFTLMLITVLLIGSLKDQAQHYRVLTLDIGISLLAVCFLLVSLAIIWHTAMWLNKIDSSRSKAEAEVKKINTELEKRVQERTAEYQQSEEKYRSLIEHASDAIYMLNNNGNFEDVNESMCKMMGYTREELLQLNVADIIDPEELKIDPLPKVLKNPDQSEFKERSFMRKDKYIFPVEINVKMFSDNRILVMARDITSRKKMETELREAELKFRTIAEKSIVGVYIVKNGKFAYVNPRFAEVFGYQTEELTNTVPIEIVFHESFKNTATENVRKRVSGEVESVHYEAIGQKKDGTTNWVEFYGSRATINGEPTIIGSMIDITERKAAEEELRSSEQQYKLLFESNPLPLWMIEKDTMNIIAVNDAAVALYGYTKDELIGAKVSRLRMKEDLGQQLRGYEEEMNSTTERGVVRHLKKDGTIMFVQIIANDIVFKGHPVRLSLTNDITEKLKAEDSLRRSEANLQTILNTTDTAYASFDRDLKLLACNQQAIDFISKQQRHIPRMGDYLTDFLPSDRIEKLLDLSKKVLSGSNVSYEIDYLQDDGSLRWYDVKLSTLISSNQEILGMLVALYDVTERKNTEQNLKIAYGRIQDQLDSIKDMAWKQSHLVRSPLANLKALSEMIKSYPGDKEVAVHFQTELNRLDAIIHEMAREAAGHDFEN